MKRGVVVLLVGMGGAAWGGTATPPAHEERPDAVVSREDVHFFLNEARRAMDAMARGESYVPEPEVASRARAIGERLRVRGVGLLERLLEQAERELLKPPPPEPDASPPSVEPPPERTRA